MGRLGVLPPNLGAARERLRPDARLERFAERLRPFESLDDRDDGIPYTYDIEYKFAKAAFDAHRETIRQMRSADEADVRVTCIAAPF